jgi:hypothetical protein
MNAYEMKVDQIAFEFDFFDGMYDLYDYLWKTDLTISSFDERENIFDDLMDCWDRRSRLMDDVPYSVYNRVYSKYFPMCV